MPTAIRCLSRAITSNYCQSDENIELIDTYLNDVEDDDDNLEGIELLTRHLGQLNTWLREVFAGTAITSEGDLANRERPILQSELLEKSYGISKPTERLDDNFLMIFKHREKKVKLLPSQLVTLLKSCKAQLSPQHREEEIPGVQEIQIRLKTLYSSLVIKNSFLTNYMTPSLSNIPLCNAAGAERPCSSLLEYTRVKGIALNINDWNDSLTNALGVVQEVLNQVNIQRARTVSVDAFGVIVRSNRDFNGETNALEALNKIKKMPLELSAISLLLMRNHLLITNYLHQLTPITPKYLTPIKPRSLRRQLSHLSKKPLDQMN